MPFFRPWFMSSFKPALSQLHNAKLEWVYGGRRRRKRETTCNCLFPHPWQGREKVCVFSSVVCACSPPTKGKYLSHTRQRILMPLLSSQSGAMRAVSSCSLRVDTAAYPNNPGPAWPAAGWLLPPGYRICSVATWHTGLARVKLTPSSSLASSALWSGVPS